MEFLVVILLVGALALFIVPRLKARGLGGSRGPGAPRGPQGAPGTLLVTGVSPRPEATGAQFVTITGVISGPTVSEHIVYQRMAVDVDAWPTMGQLFAVVYSPKNPDKWAFAPPEQAAP